MNKSTPDPKPDASPSDTQAKDAPRPTEPHRSDGGEKPREPSPETPPEQACREGETRPCYSGPANTANTGECQPGKEACVQGQWGGKCVGAVLPSKEECNGKDDDCDGKIDEDCQCTPGQSRSCYGGPTSTRNVGLCKEGTQSCDSQGAWGPCSGDVVPAKEECNGKDDDCDGQIDNGNPQGGASCNTTKQGECKAGEQTCSGGALTCQSLRTPKAEECNGKDDDCDGSVDEGNPGGGASCNSTGKGECKAGTRTCQSGTLSCVSNKKPVAETCNGKDDDCDGSVDEGNPGGGANCNTTGKGECRAGKRQCQSGALTCVANNKATPEVCDGKDNDCDGSVDEGNPGGGASCNSTGKGECKAGTRTCQSGALSCVSNKKPVAESCNNKDDDCDGSIDEGNPGGGANCNTTGKGECRAGKRTCRAGALTCVANNKATPEVCDGKDNDCDGSVDEGIASTACYQTNSGYCLRGTTACQNGNTVCNNPSSISCVSNTQCAGCGSHSACIPVFQTIRLCSR